MPHVWGIIYIVVLEDIVVCPNSLPDRIAVVVLDRVSREAAYACGTMNEPVLRERFGISDDFEGQGLERTLCWQDGLQ